MLLRKLLLQKIHIRKAYIVVVRSNIIKVL